jgi:hypothetical protein
MSYEASLPRSRAPTFEDRVADLGWSVLGKVAGWLAVFVVSAVLVSGPGGRQSRVEGPPWMAERYSPEEWSPRGYSRYGSRVYGYRSYGYRSYGYRYRATQRRWAPRHGPRPPPRYWRRWR